MSVYFMIRRNISSIANAFITFIYITVKARSVHVADIKQREEDNEGIPNHAFDPPNTKTPIISSSFY